MTLKLNSFGFHFLGQASYISCGYNSSTMPFQHSWTGAVYLPPDQISAIHVWAQWQPRDTTPLTAIPDLNLLTAVRDLTLDCISLFWVSPCLQHIVSHDEPALPSIHRPHSLTISMKSGPHSAQQLPAYTSADLHQNIKLSVTVCHSLYAVWNKITVQQTLQL